MSISPSNFVEKRLMKLNIVTLLKRSLNALGIGITSSATLKKLHENQTYGIETLLELPRSHTFELLKLLDRSKSQLRQDLFVLSQLNFKTNGFFVEFGATNGVDLSNTFLLEKEFGWSGILAEPAKKWHKHLRKNRSAFLDFDCVWRDSGSILSFNEAEVPELSTLKEFSSLDSQGALRKNSRNYMVKTISLEDLLTKHSAPSKIDYLSIDTEGSEYEILKNFDFTKYKFSIITCEHNYTNNRNRIFELLTMHGYVRVHEVCSKFDDWYIGPDISQHNCNFI